MKTTKLEQANKDITYWKERASLLLERVEKAEAALAAALETCKWQKMAWVPVEERIVAGLATPAGDVDGGESNDK